MSRPWRVAGVLAVLAWTLSEVPERVQGQRDAVVELAAERGAAAAGGALLADIGDLVPGVTPWTWRVEAGEVPGDPPSLAGLSYAEALDAVRRHRATKAAATLTADAVGAMLVRVDGDTFLVLPEGPVPAVAVVPMPPPAPTPESAEVEAKLREALDAHRDQLATLGALDAAEQIVGEVVEELSRAATPLVAGAAPVASTVAWWPPLQAAAEAHAGIPLQVGGEPPRGRLVLPGARLGGEPLWSLPTPKTEAAFTLIDGGTFLLLLVLAGALAWEAAAWRREQSRERDRQAARDAILQRLSHELRTPAASVRALMDALANPGVDEAERREFMALARSEAERLAGGIDRLLQAARGDTRLAVEPVPMDLAEWGDAVVARWSARLPGLSLRAARPSPAVADPERLDEAVDALLDNALKYGGPHVALDVAPGRFAVEDDGPGVPPADRARVLQKFERVEGRVNDPGGHGLGLWAVGEVARAHGGALKVDGASRFVVTLGAR